MGLSDESNKKDISTINIKFFASIRRITGLKEKKMDLINSIKVSDLLNSLCIKYNGLSEELYNPKTNKLHDFIVILINGRNIKYLDGLDTVLRDKDIIAIFPPTGGGCYRIH